MKHRHTLSLMQDGFTTIHVKFRVSPGPIKTYTYKALYSDNVKSGDSVVVKAVNGHFKIAVVEAVDDFPVLDLDADFDYKWIVQKVDSTEFDLREEREKEFGDTLRRLEQMKQRENLRKELLDIAGEEGVLLFRNAISKLSGNSEAEIDEEKE